MAIGCFLGGGLLGILGWVGNNVWRKHGPKIAERYPIVEKIGLAESPPDVVRREANASVRRGNIRDRDSDE